MNNFNFLTKSQAQGTEKLEVLKKFGSKCGITDFAILLGGRRSRDYSIEGGLTNKEGTTEWWTQTFDPYYREVSIISFDGSRSFKCCGTSRVGGRPYLSYSEISSLAKNKIVRFNDVLEVEYGEYPQDVVSDEEAISLENLYNDKKLSETGKKYTLYRRIERTNDYEAETYTEYSYNGKKYIRYMSDADDSKLADGRNVMKDKAYFVEVKPLKWIVDEEKDIALAKDVFFAGVPFSRTGSCDFKKSSINRFMSECLSKDIIPSQPKKQGRKVNVRFLNDKRVKEIVIRGDNLTLQFDEDSIIIKRKEPQKVKVMKKQAIK